MNVLSKISLVFTALVLAGTVVSCTNNDEIVNIEPALTPSDVLSSTPWETTGAKDRNGNDMDLNDAEINGFVGYAYFKADGNFAIYGLNNVLRSLGTWSVDPQGKTRTITALNPDGTSVFTRDVDILTLTKDIFTYRIHSNPDDPSDYYDIIHTRVAHEEPNLAQYTLASRSWETTGARDKDGNSVPLDDPRVNGFVGYSYFKADGNYTIYGLDDVLRSKGIWSVSLDGKTRTITALDDQNQPIFTRVVEILVINNNEFTYRIIPDSAFPEVFYDIVHTSVDHKEP